jgi:hypothetical protein
VDGNRNKGILAKGGWKAVGAPAAARRGIILKDWLEKGHKIHNARAYKSDSGKIGRPGDNGGRRRNNIDNVK